MGELGSDRHGKAEYGLPADGFLHVGFNFWELPGGEGPRSRRGKRPQWANMFRTGVNSLLGPGPQGPVSTVRREMLREGQQEAEARIEVEGALLAGRLPADLARECSGLLERLNAVRSRNGELFNAFETYIQMGYEACLYGYPPDWQELTADLFELAGRVQEGAGARTE
jgi:hypothetical protein